MSSALILGLALLCALLTGLAGRTLRGGLYAGLVMALSLPLLLPSDTIAGQRTDRLEIVAFSPVQLSELVLPDLWQRLPVDAPNLITLAYDTDAPTLRPQGSTLPGDARGPLAAGRLHVGISALCLALMALLGVKGGAAWIGRALLVVGLGLVLIMPDGSCAGAPTSAQVNLPQLGLVTTCFGLALLAGLALGSLKPLGEHEPVAAALFLGALAVILFAGLGAWAAWAGSTEPQEIVEPLLDRLAHRGAPAPTPLACNATAAHLVHVLDQGALAALAAMIALLLHLKGRRLPTAILVFLVTAGELLVARDGWPFT